MRQRERGREEPERGCGEGLPHRDLELLSVVMADFGERSGRPGGVSKEERSEKREEVEGYL
jgi:hypothetical protein